MAAISSPGLHYRTACLRPQVGPTSPMGRGPLLAVGSDALAMALSLAWLCQVRATGEILA